MVAGGVLELGDELARPFPFAGCCRSAVQLFRQRGMASACGFDIAAADVPAVLEIWRSLDSMLLALELTAARVDAFGITV